MPKHELSLYEVVENFHTYNRTSKSERTCDWYRKRLAHFARWLTDDLGQEPRLADFDLERYRRFVVYLKSRTDKQRRNAGETNGQLAPHTIHGYQRALRTFASFLYADRYTSENLLGNEKPSVPKHQQPEILTEDEQATLLSSFDLDDPLDFRNYAIVFTFLSTGLRNNELCGLTLQTVHIDGKGQPYLDVAPETAKGEKGRKVPLGPSCQKVLLDWRQRYRRQFENYPSNAFFLTCDGNPLTDNCVDRMIKRVGKKAGIPRLYPHLLRHTFATFYLIHRLGDTLRLQQILGHTSLEMVRHYANWAAIELNLLQGQESPTDILMRNRPGVRPKTGKRKSA
jgi:site-specific recombinase XerD